MKIKISPEELHQLVRLFAPYFQRLSNTHHHPEGSGDAGDLVTPVGKTMDSIVEALWGHWAPGENPVKGTYEEVLEKAGETLPSDEEIKAALCPPTSSVTLDESTDYSYIWEFDLSEPLPDLYDLLCALDPHKGVYGGKTPTKATLFVGGPDPEDPVKIIPFKDTAEFVIREYLKTRNEEYPKRYGVRAVPETPGPPVSVSGVTPSKRPTLKPIPIEELDSLPKAHPSPELPRQISTVPIPQEEYERIRENRMAAEQGSGNPENAEEMVVGKIKTGLEWLLGNLRELEPEEMDEELQTLIGLVEELDEVQQYFDSTYKEFEDGSLQGLGIVGEDSEEDDSEEDS